MLFLPFGVIDAFTALDFVFLLLECSIIRAACDFDERKIGKSKFKAIRKMVQSKLVQSQKSTQILKFKKGDYMMATSNFYTR